MAPGIAGYARQAGAEQRRERLAGVKYVAIAHVIRDVQRRGEEQRIRQHAATTTRSCITGARNDERDSVEATSGITPA